jgi:hypothetical protein
VNESDSTALTHIYDSTDVEVWRWSDDRAVVSVERSILVVRPWAFSEPSSWNFPHGAIVEKWAKSPPRAMGGCDLGRLLVWASKRTPLNTYAPGDDDVMFRVERDAYDIQLVHDTPFNRRAIREALQTLVEMGCEASVGITLELLTADGKVMMRMTLGRKRVVIYVMSCKPGTECGGDPMPVAWESGGTDG